MSLIENIRGKPGPKPLQADAVLAKLKETEAELADLEQQHGGAALDAIAGGSDTELARINRALATVRERVSTLKAAHRVAVERDEATIRAQRVALQKTQLNAARKHLEMRDAAVLALEAAIADAVKHYHAVLDRSAKAQSACPMGMSWPPASHCDPDTLRNLLTYELQRVSASPGNRDGRAFPGSQLPGMQYEWQPAAIPAMAGQIKDASAFVIATLADKVAG